MATTPPTDNDKAGMQAELDKLRQENEALKAEVAKLRNAIPRYQTGVVSDDYEEFVEAEGVLWKRAADGSYQRNVYCPNCRLVLLPVPSDNPANLVCTKCRFHAPFGVAELEDVARRAAEAGKA